MKQLLPKGNKSAGIILLASVIVLVGIILVLMIGSYLSINSIRWQTFSLPRAAQSLSAAESCVEIAIARLRVNPAYTTQNGWEEIKEGNIVCRYSIQDEEGKKVIKAESSVSNYFKKILVNLKILGE